MSEKSCMEILNLKEVADKTSKNLSAVDLSRQLQRSMLQIKGECMSEDGKGVNYTKLKTSQLFKDYCLKSAPLLQTVKLEGLSENEKKAFFINIYNALTIHGLAELPKLPDSVLHVRQFWKNTGYRIAGYDFSLDDIEHGILRGNRSHPASTVPQFDAKDPRLNFAVKKLDPKIHFALVCGAKSCPAINVYSAENVDKALDAATRSFCSQEVSMFTEVDEIWLSKIFQWYREDFGNTDVDVIRWTMPYLEPKIQDRAHLLLFKLEKVCPIDIRYNEYDWNLNSAS